MDVDAAGQAGHLRLERRFANLAFCSWRLSSTLVQAQGTVALPAPVVPPQAADTDYVTARHAALLNGLTQQPRGCYLFLEGQQGAAALQLCAVELAEAGKAPQLHHLAGVAAPPPNAPAGGLAGGELPPSVVEVQVALAPGDAAGSLLLVSSGHGDVSLVAPQSAGQQGEAAVVQGASALSPPVFPLRPAPPLLGARPLHLASAFVLPPEACSAASSGSVGSGEAQLCAILWAARQRSGRHPSCCEVYAVHLAAAVHPAPALRVLSVQLLKVSDLPPHGVLVNPATGGVLLALQPSPGGAAEDEAAAQRAAAEAAGSSGAGQAGGDGNDGDDMSPRTLQAAVARLAAFTSEEPVGPLPHQQYADLYREAGADGVGAMGSEPTCSLYTFALAPAGDGSAQAAQQPAQGGQAGHLGGQPLLRLVHKLSCQPHKLLTCHLEQPAGGAQEPPTPDTHLQGGGVGEGAAGAANASGSGSRCGNGSHASPRLLLGLTDDVDCAVVAIGCTSPEAAAAASGGGSGAAGPEEAAAGFVIQHVASVPALSYVAAGKVQRKFLLLAPPGGDIAAALVEASKYCYVYRTTAPRQEYGEHQVVDMELPDSGGRGVLGAVLAGSRAGACRLLVLAREGLRVIDM